MFSLLIVLFAFVGFGLALFLIVLLLINPKNYQALDNDAAIIIVKVVESCRESLPLNSAHGWYLTPCSGSLRCWKKELSFHLLGSPVTVYACSKEINCAAVILLNVIADVSTWSEWDIQVQDQTVHLELPENPSLHGDAYMKCDQLVLTSSMLKADPEVQMYRFGNLESNGTGWILLWNAKYLDWILYIAQPIDNDADGNDNDGDENSDVRCLLTAIWGLELNHPHKYNIPELLCSKLLNLSEAINYSQLKLRPFQSLLYTSSINAPHFPTIHSALDDLPEKPCVLLEHDKKQQSFSSQNKVLAVKPVSIHKPLTSKNISGFTLTLCPLKKVSKSGSICDSVASEEKRKSRRRQKFRSDSISANFPRIKGLSFKCRTVDFILPDKTFKQLELETRRSSSLSTPIRKKPPELTITQPDEDLKPPQRSSSHSFLSVFFQRRRSSDGSKRSRSPSPRRNSATEKKSKFSFEKTSSMSSQEDLANCLSPNQNGSDVSDVEKSYFKINDAVQSDYQSLGEYSVSAVLQEKLKTSLLDIKTPEEEQKRVSGGWIYKETNKDISVFKKTSYFDSCVVLSYLCKGIISTPLQTVWKTLCNPMTRFMYDDDSIKKIKILKEFPSGQKLIHMYNESVSFLKKEVQDFCLLQTEKIEGNQYILGLHSVKDDVCPPTKDVARGAIIASGWVLESGEDNSTLVSYLVQMLVNSLDISTVKDISNTQCQCIHNLRIYLSTKPPCSFHAQSDGGSC